MRVRGDKMLFLPVKTVKLLLISFPGQTACCVCFGFARSFILHVTRKKHIFFSCFYYAYALIRNVKVMNLNAVEKSQVNEFERCGKISINEFER